MTTYERASALCFCGRCGQWIRRGDRLAVVAFPALAAGRTVRVRKIRCVACAHTDAVTARTQPPQDEADA